MLSLVLFYCQLRSVWRYDHSTGVCVVVQFYPWFKCYFLLFWGMAMYDNELNPFTARVLDGAL